MMSLYGTCAPPNGTHRVFLPLLPRQKKAHGDLKRAIMNGGCGQTFMWSTMAKIVDSITDFDGNRTRCDPPVRFKSEIAHMKKTTGIILTDEEERLAAAYEKAHNMGGAEEKEAEGVGPAQLGEELFKACASGDSQMVISMFAKARRGYGADRQNRHTLVVNHQAPKVGWDGDGDWFFMWLFPFFWFLGTDGDDRAQRRNWGRAGQHRGCVGPCGVCGWKPACCFQDKYRNYRWCVPPNFGMHVRMALAIIAEVAGWFILLSSGFAEDTFANRYYVHANAGWGYEGGSPLGFGLVTVGHLAIAWCALIVSASTYNTPLTAAAARGSRDICAILIRNGADVNLAARSSMTPLMAAAVNGHTKLCKYVEKGDR